MQQDEEIRKTVSIIFDIFDKDRDGYLNKIEIKEYLNEAMKKIEKRDVTN